MRAEETIKFWLLSAGESSYRKIFLAAKPVRRVGGTVKIPPIVQSMFENDCANRPVTSQNSCAHCGARPISTEDAAGRAAPPATSLLEPGDLYHRVLIQSDG